MPGRRREGGNNRPFCELRSRHYRRFSATSGWMYADERYRYTRQRKQYRRHRLDGRITSAGETNSARAGTEEDARPNRPVGRCRRSVGRGSKGETLVIRSIVQANDAMIRQHKLIRPLQLPRRAAPPVGTSDRLHARPRLGHQLTRDGLSSPDLIGHARFSAINLIFSPTSRDAKAACVHRLPREITPPRETLRGTSLALD